jgi:Domain of unknown function (DUF4326)
MPANTVYVGRPSKWGNPHNVTKYQTREACIDAYRRLVTSYPKYRMWMSELRGKNLACWCRLDQPCHADVLLEIANAAPTLRTPEKQPY